jgi:hypothetical protein
VTFLIFGDPPIPARFAKEEANANAIDILRRLITCADNGYDTAELSRIVTDAKKAVGK